MQRPRDPEETTVLRWGGASRGETGCLGGDSAEVVGRMTDVLA